MNVLSTGYALFNKLTNFVSGLSQEHQQPPPSPLADTLQQEIYQIEKMLADTRPSSAICKIKPSEPVTEQQKIIDLAG